jgi:hypothetical protein
VKGRERKIYYMTRATTGGHHFSTSSAIFGYRCEFWFKQMTNWGWGRRVCTNINQSGLADYYGRVLSSFEGYNLGQDKQVIVAWWVVCPVGVLLFLRHSFSPFSQRCYRSVLPSLIPR